MQLLQQKLCAGLGDIDQLQQADMLGLAHAIARLTQASISLQRWTNELKRQAGGRNRNTPGGLSPQTAQALRNALLGVEPSSPEQLRPQTTGPGQNEPNPAPQTAKAGEFGTVWEAARAGSG